MVAASIAIASVQMNAGAIIGSKTMPRISVSAPKAPEKNLRRQLREQQREHAEHEVVEERPPAVQRLEIALALDEMRLLIFAEPPRQRARVDPAQVRLLGRRIGGEGIRRAAFVEPVNAGAFRAE